MIRSDQDERRSPAARPAEPLARVRLRRTRPRAGDAQGPRAPLGRRGAGAPRSSPASRARARAGSCASSRVPPPTRGDDPVRRLRRASSSPPYGPFAAALEHLVRHGDPDALRRHLGPGGRELIRLYPIWRRGWVSIRPPPRPTTTPSATGCTRRSSTCSSGEQGRSPAARARGRALGRRADAAARCDTSSARAPRRACSSWRRSATPRQTSRRSSPTRSSTVSRTEGVAASGSGRSTRRRSRSSCGSERLEPAPERPRGDHPADRGQRLPRHRAVAGARRSDASRLGASGRAISPGRHELGAPETVREVVDQRLVAPLRGRERRARARRRRRLRVQARDAPAGGGRPGRRPDSTPSTRPRHGLLASRRGAGSRTASRTSSCAASVTDRLSASRQAELTSASRRRSRAAGSRVTPGVLAALAYHYAAAGVARRHRARGRPRTSSRQTRRSARSPSTRRSSGLRTALELGVAETRGSARSDAPARLSHHRAGHADAALETFRGRRPSRARSVRPSSWRGPRSASRRPAGDPRSTTRARSSCSSRRSRHCRPTTRSSGRRCSEASPGPSICAGSPAGRRSNGTSRSRISRRRGDRHTLGMTLAQSYWSRGSSTSDEAQRMLQEACALGRGARRRRDPRRGARLARSLARRALRPPRRPGGPDGAVRGRPTPEPAVPPPRRRALRERGRTLRRRPRRGGAVRQPARRNGAACSAVATRPGRTRSRCSASGASRGGSRSWRP